MKNRPSLLRVVAGLLLLGLAAVSSFFSYVVFTFAHYLSKLPELGETKLWDESAASTYDASGPLFYSSLGVVSALLVIVLIICTWRILK
ncbi:MAG: hypothetical protein WC777_02020 [Candidatus Gracilibacteria bacterium]|jgi:hypothetical protein